MRAGWWARRAAVSALTALAMATGAGVAAGQPQVDPSPGGGGGGGSTGGGSTSGGTSGSRTTPAAAASQLWQGITGDSTHVEAVNVGTALPTGTIGEPCGDFGGTALPPLAGTDVQRVRALPLATIGIATGAHDGILMTTAPSVSLAPNQSLVTFTVTTGSGKDLSFRNGCVPGEVAKLHESGASGAPVTLLIQRPASNDRLHGVDTVVFRKPGFLGIWSDVAHLDPDTFWALAGGRTVTFTWVRD